MSNNLEVSPTNNNRSLQPKFRQQFHKQVLIKLLEIINLSKQEDLENQKIQIQKSCDEIALLGRKAQIPNWGELLATVKRAINNEEEDYGQVIKIIIQEIKNSAELVLKDEIQAIKVSEELKTLSEVKKKEKRVISVKDKLDTQSRKTASGHKTHKNLAKVNAVDLNSLADVFEVDNELDNKWQSGEVISSDTFSDLDEDVFANSGNLMEGEETDEINELFAEELSLIQINPTKKKRKKRTLGTKETVMLFGEDFSFQDNNKEGGKSEPNPFDDQPDIKSFDIEDFSLEIEDEPSNRERKNEEEELEFSINKMFEGDFSLEEEKEKEEKKKKAPGKDTMLLFGEDFSFEEAISEAIQEEEEDLDPRTTKVKAGEVFGDELSLNLKPKTRKKKKVPAGSEDTTILFGKDFSFEEEDEHETEDDDLMNSDLSVDDLFGDQSLEDQDLFDLDTGGEPDFQSELDDLFEDGETTELELDDLFIKPRTNEELELAAFFEDDSNSGGLELEDLFGEEDSSSTSELDNLFEEDSSSSSELDNLFEDEDSSSSSELDNLFEELEEDNSLNSLELDLSDLLTEEEENKEESIGFYPDWSELATLIEADSEEEKSLDVNNLTSLIEAPVLETNLTEEEESGEDEDFSDVEAMLQQSSPNLNAQAGAGGKSGFEQTMKVPVKQLDNLNNLMGELVVNRNSLEQSQERMRQFLENLLNHAGGLSDVGSRMQDLYERSLLESSLLAAREGIRHGSVMPNGSTPPGISDVTVSQDQDYDPLEMDRFTGFHLLSQEMIELIVRVRESASDIQFVVDETEQVGRNLRQITSQLQEGLNKSRMVPFAETTDRMRAAVRRVSVKLQKQAELEIEGRDVLIDKMIAEHLFDPMTHLINNALTHGVELPAEREAKGKSPVGKITMGAYIQGNQTIISVSDDGAGINAEVVKRKAVEKGIITRLQSDRMTDRQAFDLIFNAGFSTKEKADDFAGRGVGMDVVRTALNEIRGTITIDSEIGKGTTFTIRLPLMLTISKALCCLSGHHRIAFPMDGVEDMQDFFPAEIKTNEKGEQVIPWRNHLLPFKPLTELLKYNRKIGRGNVYGGKREDDMISMVILRSSGHFFAVQVDQVLGEQEIVIKQIQGPVPKPPGIAGATVLGDGRVMGIVDVIELIDIAQGRIRHQVGGLWENMTIEPAESEVRTEPLVLVVDDSVTVRAMLSLSFTKAGYRVEEARDGQEAWDKLRSGLPCDVIFCDIEMPRMNGLELLGNIQKDEELNHLPVAMLTSRGADRHKQMAAQLGASAYFTKPYLEEALLDGAARMLKGDVLMANSTRKPGKRIAKSQQRAQEATITQVEAPVVSSINDIPTVLIIDDSVVVRELLSATFQNAGFQVEQARDGQEAWDQLNDELHCDVIFCDIEMPRMNGLDLLANLQEHEELSKIPVAMLTSRGAERHRRLAAERGAKGYFTKPYMDEVLLDAAQRLMRGDVLIEDFANA